MILARRTSACGEDGRRTIASSFALSRDPKATTSWLAARAMPHLRVIGTDRQRMPGTRSHLAAARAPGNNDPMPVPSRRLKDLIEGTVDHHASQRWPALEESPSPGVAPTAT